jgi:hypothetical protein
MVIEKEWEVELSEKKNQDARVHFPSSEKVKKAIFQDCV